MKQRLKGAKLSIIIDAIEYNCDVTSTEIDNGDASGTDVLTFCEVDDEDSGLAYTLKITATQDTSSESFWSLVWDRSGEIVEVLVAPHGNEIPTTDQPHFHLEEVKIGTAPKLGGQASRTDTWTFDTEWEIKSGKPRIDRGN